jgi:hypothetical protein
MPPHRIRAPALLGLLALFQAGCGLRGSGTEPAPPTPEPAPVASEPVSSAPAVADRVEEILAEGQAFLAAGELQASRARFEYVLDRAEEDGPGVAAGLRARALWHLSVIHLLGIGASGDGDRALALLTRLVEEHPLTPEAVQARWVRGLLQELEGARREKADQERVIRELTETVEQLRRIDLNRRPSPPRPDTFTSRSPAGRPPVPLRH